MIEPERIVDGRQAIDVIKDNIQFNALIYNGKSALDKDIVDNFHNQKIVIVAAGPTLDKKHEKLTDLQKAGFKILCTDRALACIHETIKPDIVFTIDPSKATTAFLDGIDTSDMVLVAELKANPDFTRSWKGKIYWHMFVPGRDDHYDFFMKYIIDLKLPAYETVLHVTGAAYCWAGLLGYAECAFLGADYAYYGIEYYDEQRQTMCFMITQYYARPLENINYRYITYKINDHEYMMPAGYGNVAYPARVYPYKADNTPSWSTGLYTDDHFMILKQKLAEIPDYVNSIIKNNVTFEDKTAVLFMGAKNAD